MATALERIRRPKLTVPVDITAAVLLVAVADLRLIGIPPGIAPVMALVGLPVVLFVPGYLLVVTLYPRQPSPGVGKRESTVGGLAAGHTRIRLIERAALSFGLSLAVVPLLALASAPFTDSFADESVLAVVSLFVVVFALAGTARRNLVPEAERFRLPIGAWIDALRGLAAGASRLDRALAVLLVVAVVAGTAAVGVAALAPGDGERYTSAALLTTGEDGDLVAAGYPTEFTRGEGQLLALRVTNHESVRTTYTVVTTLQRVDDGGAVASEAELHRAREAVAAGGVWTHRHAIEPTMSGGDLRLNYLVYRGEPPADPTRENAYRALHLWVSVSDPAA